MSMMPRASFALVTNGCSRVSRTESTSSASNVDYQICYIPIPNSRMAIRMGKFSLLAFTTEGASLRRVDGFEAVLPFERFS